MQTRSRCIVTFAFSSLNTVPLTQAFSREVIIFITQINATFIIKRKLEIFYLVLSDSIQNLFLWLFLEISLFWKLQLCSASTTLIFSHISSFVFEYVLTQWMTCDVVVLSCYFLTWSDQSVWGDCILDQSDFNLPTFLTRVPPAA